MLIYDVYLSVSVHITGDISSNLSWNTHVDTTAKKATQTRLCP